MLKLCKIYACPNGTLGLHLSRAPWDPYPWVSGVQDGSHAHHAGVRSGDAVLELNGNDVLGQKISEIAGNINQHWERGERYVTVVIWRNKTENSQIINQHSLQKFATCLQHIAQLLECPVCFEVVKPPGWQCCNGHVLCNGCRSRTVKCPVCRVTLGPRGRCLLSDKLFNLLAESFPCDGEKGNNGSPADYKRCPRFLHDDTKNVTTTSRAKEKAVSSNRTGSRSRTTGKGHLDEMKILKSQNDKIFEPTNDVNEDVRRIEGQHSVPMKFSISNVFKLKLKSNNKNQNSPSLCHFASDEDEYRNAPSGRKQQRQMVAQYTRKSYNCPTGKSCFLPSASSSSSSFSTSSSSLSSETKRSNCRDNITIDSNRYSRRNLKSDYIWCGKIEKNHFARHNSSNNECSSLPWKQRLSISGTELDLANCNDAVYSEWDILSHLTRNHQISVAQHYGTYGEKIQVYFMNSKSIPCISIPYSESVGYLPPHRPRCSYSCCHQNQHIAYSSTSSSFTITSTQKSSPSSSVTPQNNAASSLNLFDRKSRNGHQDLTTTKQLEREKKKITISKVSGSSLEEYGNCIACRQCQDRERILPLASKTELFFIARIPLTDDNDSGSDEGDAYSPEHNRVANCNCIESSSDQSNDKRNLTSSIDSPARIVTAPYTVTTPTPTTTRHAIFIWYFGSETDTDNFQSIIQCKRTGAKWAGHIHPLTKSWTSVRHQKQFHLYDAHALMQSNVGPVDADGDFFDIVIKIK